MPQLEVCESIVKSLNKLIACILENKIISESLIIETIKLAR